MPFRQVNIPDVARQKLCPPLLGEEFYLHNLVEMVKLPYRRVLKSHLQSKLLQWFPGDDVYILMHDSALCWELIQYEPHRQHVGAHHTAEFKKVITSK